MFMYEVFRVVGSTAPINNKCKTKLLKIANVVASNSSKACSKARKQYPKIGKDEQILAHMTAMVIE